MPETLLLPCSCGDTSHVMVFERYVDGDYVSCHVMDEWRRPRSLVDGLRLFWEALTGGRACRADVMLSADDLARIEYWCAETRRMMEEDVHRQARRRR